jgi:hypothetical protein
MDWITGVKLTTLPPDEIRALVKVGERQGAGEKDAPASSPDGISWQQ